MNKKQKLAVIISVSIVLATIAVWLLFGGEIFTKTQVLVEKKDELFGWTEKTWEDKFIWGLDLSLLVSAISLAIGSILFFVFRSKKNFNNQQ
ncbi:MAG: hypothetical protein FJ214_00860 [Ignavibacteria bacterium]|nr:hypothetical protein [Ignavibacteria bacterium]